MKADQTANFVKKHWLLLSIVVVAIFLLPKIISTLKDLLSPLSEVGKGVASVVSLPRKFVEAMNENLDNAVNERVYKGMLKYVSSNNYNPDLKAEFDNVTGNLPKGQVEELFKVWKKKKSAVAMIGLIEMNKRDASLLIADLIKINPYLKSVIK